MNLPVFEMTFPHFYSAKITMMKTSTTEFSVEIEDDYSRYEFHNGLTFEEARNIIDTEIAIYASKLMGGN